jgi:hypothetical protein
MALVILSMPATIKRHQPIQRLPQLLSHINSSTTFLRRSRKNRDRLSNAQSHIAYHQKYLIFYFPNLANEKQREMWAN